MKSLALFLINILFIVNTYAGREFKRSSTTTSVEKIEKLAKRKYEKSNDFKTLPLAFLSISDLSGLQEIIPDNCTHLDLSKNHLTNTGLQSFKEISSQTIKSIDLADNDFTHIAEEEIKQLKDSFPQLNALHLSKKKMKHWKEIKEAAKKLNINIQNSEKPQPAHTIPYIITPSDYNDEEPFSSDGQLSPQSITSGEEETIPLLSESTSSDSDDE